MFSGNAKQLVEEYGKRSYPKSKIQINHRIWFYVNWGLCNCTVIEGDKSVILIDTLDSDLRVERLKKDISESLGKPVKTIIFTHSHRDHIGGAGVFKDSNPEVITFSSKYPILKHSDKLNNILNKRLVRQFGYTLSSEDYLAQGVSSSDSNAVGDGKFNFITPTKIYNEEKIYLEIDGVKLELIAAPGETDDHIFVWLPDDNILCCGDNYYGCFPNLYAVRGGQYRDIAQWIDSIRSILKYPADAVLPGHTLPLIGRKQIEETIKNYADAIESILFQTLDCMNKGMSMSETVQSVKLDEKYAGLPYMGEFYGTVEWSVKSIYTGYFGWFDGNPANLFPVSDNEYSAEILKLVGKDTIIKSVDKNIKNNKYQLAAQLAQLVLNAVNNDNSITPDDIKYLKKQLAVCYRRLGEMQTSLNGRHYYLACSNELLKEI